MKIFDNINATVKDDLATSITPNSRLSIAAACFSIYAYEALKKQLDGIQELRFIFTSPAFVTEKFSKEKREFYIPRLNRERSLYGTEFEVKLRNELSQKAVAKECAAWIRQKVQFRSNITTGNMTGFLNVDTATYAPLQAFTTADLGCDRGSNIYNMVQKIDAPMSLAYLKLFDTIWNDTTLLQDVTEDVIASITAAYNENSPEFLYFVTLYNLFSEFLEDISDDTLPNEATGFKESKIWNLLYTFQKDATLAIINKLEKFNGCILADSVGLGKTFTALGVIKYYENRNKTVLILCPKKLAGNWNTYKDNYVNNPVAADRFNYDVLYHTDLSRTRGTSNGLDLSRLNWGNYDLVVIDESHNFRNGGVVYGEGERENRYLRLLNKIIRAGVRTKILMLSATPVNNRFTDLRNQLELAYEGNPSLINSKLNTSKPIDEIFRNAQRVFNEWSKNTPEKRVTSELLQKLDFDFFEVLDSVTIARSRKHIEKYYNMEEIGTFPTRLKPLSLRPSLTNLEDGITYNQIYEQLEQLHLHIYMPTAYIFPSKLAKYVDASVNINRSGREQGIRKLMSINLLKRLESSVHAFSLTLTRIAALIQTTLADIDAFVAGTASAPYTYANNFDADLDYDDQNTDFFSSKHTLKINFHDMDYQSWREELQHDAAVLHTLGTMVATITPEYDLKLQTLLRLLEDKIAHPINPGNKKLLIFSAFADTAIYLYEHVSLFIKQRYGLHTALITGTVEGKTTLPKFHGTLNTILTCFSPLSKDKAVLMPHCTDTIDVLIGTDCISEGQNLQDCDYCVNYDIHWNPVRIIQRFGRIDRIGSQNAVIQLVNFWPDLTLDDYINLKNRVETRMKLSIMTSTGDDDLINAEEKGDLAYRKAQLERLQHETVDLEDMSTGISIMDLGLNEFRLDLLDYLTTHGDLDKAPFGMHALLRATATCPSGAIFILKNINGSVNTGNQNRLHPFYMVYIADSGNIVCNHLTPKQLLDDIRLLCKGQSEPHHDLCRSFNQATQDGRDMRCYSQLLEKAICSIIDVNAAKAIDSLFTSGGTSALQTTLHGLNDFELIAFFVVR